MHPGRRKDWSWEAKSKPPQTPKTLVELLVNKWVAWDDQNQIQNVSLACQGSPEPNHQLRSCYNRSRVKYSRPGQRCPGDKNQNWPTQPLRPFSAPCSGLLWYEKLLTWMAWKFWRGPSKFKNWAYSHACVQCVFIKHQIPSEARTHSFLQQDRVENNQFLLITRQHIIKI